MATFSLYFVLVTLDEVVKGRGMGWIRAIIILLIAGLTLLSSFSRVFLVVESFLSLRRNPIRRILGSGLAADIATHLRVLYIAIYQWSQIC